MFKRLVFLPASFSTMILVLTLAACTAGTATPSLAPDATTTPSVLPSATTTLPPPSPTATLSPTATQAPTLKPTTLPPTATATPYPPLHTSGPYFVYTKEEAGDLKLVILDQDGSGRRVIDLPEGSHISQLSNAISPDGQWLAFHTSSAFKQQDWLNADASDLKLNLLNLKDGSVQTVAALLSQDYPNNLQETSNFIIRTEPQNYIPTLNDLKNALLGGITSFDWSNSSRYLAFAGEMNGPSSDLYLYDLGNESTTQLSNGPEEIQLLYWSRDNTRIIYQSTFSIGEGECGTRYELDFSTFVTQNNGEHCLFHNGDDSIKINIPAWPSNLATAIAQDTRNKLTLIYIDYEASTEEYPAGLYLVDQKKCIYKKVIEGSNWLISFLESPKYRFIARDKNRTIAIRADGTWAQLLASSLEPSQSPDNQWLALYNDHEIDIANQAGVILKRNDIFEIRSVAWLPDSSAVLFTTFNSLYYWPISKEKQSWIPLNDAGGKTINSTVQTISWNPNKTGVFINTEGYIYFLSTSPLGQANLIDQNTANLYNYFWFTPQ